MIISGVVIAALVGVVAGISMGWIPNPFGKGMQTADFKSSGQPSTSVWLSWAKRRGRP